MELSEKKYCGPRDRGRNFCHAECVMSDGAHDARTQAATQLKVRVLSGLAAFSLWYFCDSALYFAAMRSTCACNSALSGDSSGNAMMPSRIPPEAQNLFRCWYLGTRQSSYMMSKSCGMPWS